MALKPCTGVPINLADGDTSKQSRQLLLLMLRMDDMNAGLSRREPLNVTAEPGHDLLKTDVFHVVETVRAEDRGDTSRLEAADPLLVDLLKPRHPSGRIGLHVFTPVFGRLGVVEHHFRV